MRYSVKCADGYYTVNGKGDVSVVGADRARLCYTRASVDAFVKKLKNMKYATEVETCMIVSEEVIHAALTVIEAAATACGKDENLAAICSEVASMLKEIIREQQDQSGMPKCPNCGKTIETKTHELGSMKLCEPCYMAIMANAAPAVVKIAKPVAIVKPAKPLSRIPEGMSDKEFIRWFKEKEDDDIYYREPEGEGYRLYGEDKELFNAAIARVGAARTKAHEESTKTITYA